MLRLRLGHCKAGPKCTFKHACAKCFGPHPIKDCPQVKASLQGSTGAKSDDANIEVLSLLVPDSVELQSPATPASTSPQQSPAVDSPSTNLGSIPKILSSKLFKKTASERMLVAAIISASQLDTATDFCRFRLKMNDISIQRDSSA